MLNGIKAQKKLYGKTGSLDQRLRKYSMVRGKKKNDPTAEWNSDNLTGEQQLGNIDYNGIGYKVNGWKPYILSAVLVTL